MYSTEIKLESGKVIPIKFGAYVSKLISDGGCSLSELQEAITATPFDIIPKIFYYGAINASKNRQGEGIDINDIYDWLDEQQGGLMGAESSKILNLFAKQLSDGVPVQEAQKGEAKKKK